MRSDMSFSKYFDHTLLKPETTLQQIQQLCAEATTYHFFSVCIPPYYVKTAKECLEHSDVKVCTVVGFPLGHATTATKAFETQDAINNGAQEIDMVLNISALKNNHDSFVLEDIQAVVQSANGNIVKVILETCLLSDEEIIRACHLAQQAGAHFVKTSTGFSKAGATVEHIALMRKTVGPDFGVKASGGIRNKKIAEQLIAAGASRLGASASVDIVSGKDTTGIY